MRFKIQLATAKNLLSEEIVYNQKTAMKFQTCLLISSFLKVPEFYIKLKKNMFSFYGSTKIIWRPLLIYFILQMQKVKYIHSLLPKSQASSKNLYINVTVFFLCKLQKEFQGEGIHSLKIILSTSVSNKKKIEKIFF